MDQARQSEIDGKIGDFEVLTDQLKKSILGVGSTSSQAIEGWHGVSLIVDVGVCDAVVDPRALPGYLLRETGASKFGHAFLTTAGDPISQ